MVVKNQIKFIKSLQQKKYRIQSRMFVVEGIKVVQELLASHFRPYRIYTTDLGILDCDPKLVEKISEGDLKKISGLQTPNTVLGIFYMSSPNTMDFSDWILALDDLRDPGNLGTVIRLCDWFGIKHLVCSEHTVDCYNPKVLQASMGSIARVNIIYTELPDFIEKSEIPVYGAFMEGENLYRETLPEAGILVMGNEAKGISKTLEGLVQKKLAIPPYGERTAESLNVATATAILLSELRRS